DARVVMLDVRRAAAAKVAKVLQDKGWRVSELVGGMQQWRQYTVQADAFTNARVRIVQFHRLGSGCLSYGIVSGGCLAVIDPLLPVDDYLVLAEREHAQITHVIDTHVHTDHVSGARELLRRTNAVYLVPHSEIHHERLVVTKLDRGTLRMGAVDMQVRMADTEGEVGGSALLVVDDACVLTGDAVIVGEVGIADLSGSAHEWAEKLFNTVLRTQKSLSDDALLLPAHYADVQAVNAAGVVGAVLGDVRLGAEAMARVNNVKFSDRPVDFVAALHRIDDDIRRYNTGVSPDRPEELGAYP
ncbi:MAG: MBL fold metallo-hydrolase, partial [Firmicutes bacterium]|nr:MBL fold metallo-hydrolase [Bacillota bacterium]